MMYRFLISVAFFFPASIHAMDYSALKNTVTLSSDLLIQPSSIEIQYDKRGLGRNEKIQLFINNVQFSELTNKQKLIISILPGSYSLEIRKGENVLDKSLKKASAGQKLSWLIPHNSKAQEKAAVVISFP
jgi:hypothetical protein